MGKLFGHLAVIGKHQHTRGGLVQAAHRKQAHASQFRRQQIQHGFLTAVLGHAQHAFGLVHHIVVKDAVLQRLTVHQDPAGFTVKLLFGPRDGDAVHLDSSAADDVPELTAGGHSQVSQQLVQTFDGHGGLPFRKKSRHYNISLT